MNRLGTFAGSAVALALAVSGCAKTPPYPTILPTSTTPSPVISVTPSVSPTSASPSPSPSATQLVLSGTGLGELAFGSAEADVLAVLTENLGDPESTTQGETCKDASGLWGKTVVHNGIVVGFAAKNLKKTSPRTLVYWRFATDTKLPKTVAVADTVPLNLTFNQLKAKYPAAKYIDLGMPDGTKALQLPNKITFTGIGTPDMVWGGEIVGCE
jgi:hypothetical protein